MLHAVLRNSTLSAGLVVCFLTFGTMGDAQVSLQQANRAQPVQTAAIRSPQEAAHADRTFPTPPQTVEAALQQIASQAAVIFTGSVTRVTEKLAGGEVEFAVEQGLRGVASGSTYRIRVSAWGGGVQRYSVGERALFLLHAPSAAGFSSPVNGDESIVPLSGDALVGSVDLRWIATGVVRSVAVQNLQSQAVTVHRQTAVAVPFTNAATGAGVQTIQNADAQSQLAVSNVTGQDVHAIDRDLITGMLRTWAAVSAGQVR